MLLQTFLSLSILALPCSCSNVHNSPKANSETQSNSERDTFDLPSQSTEGGFLVLVDDGRKRIWDFNIFGEMGKLHYTFNEDENHRLVSAVKTDYRYDGAITDADLKMDSTTYYINFLPIPPLIQDRNKKYVDGALKDSILAATTNFFKETLRANELEFLRNKD